MKTLIRNSCIAIAILRFWAGNPAHAHDNKPSHNNGHHKSAAHHWGYRGDDQRHKGQHRHYLVKKPHYKDAHKQHSAPHSGHYLNDHRGIIYIKPFALYLHNKHHESYHHGSRYHSRDSGHYSRKPGRHDHYRDYAHRY